MGVFYFHTDSEGPLESENSLAIKYKKVLFIRNIVLPLLKPKKINVMYKEVKEYYQFLNELEKQKDEFLSNTKQSVDQQMDVFMSEHGWVRKGKGQKVTYTKKFNGKDIVIGFRCNYNDNLGNGGLPEFLHDKSIPNSIEKVQMGYFHWNDQNTSGWSLDVVMERMEVFYNKYTS